MKFKIILIVEKLFMLFCFEVFVLLIENFLMCNFIWMDVDDELEILRVEEDVFCIYE